MLLQGLALLRNGADDGSYTLVSTWDGEAGDVGERDFSMATGKPHDAAVAALQKLDGLGCRGDPQVYESVAGSIMIS